MQRQTRQRGAIREALAAAARPLSPQELLSAARAALPRLGIATVYRTVKGLLAEGALHVVELPGAPARDELAGTRHPHHVHSPASDAGIEGDACPAGIRRLLPGGFRLERHEIILYGLCAECGGVE